MPIKQWHAGKVVLVWVVAAVVGFFGVGFATELEGVGTAVMVLILAVAVPAAVTWTWLSGRE